MKSAIYPTIAPLGTILSVWAHPDDESWSAAGIMMAAVANGQRVVCVTATRGEQGVQNEARWPQANLGQIREKELEASLDVMGIHDHHWLNYHDGFCTKVPIEQAVHKLLPIIKEVQPDTILTFGPDGFTGHDDHKTVSRWVDLALAKQPIQKPVQVFHVMQSEEWYNTVGKKWDRKFDVFFNIDHPRLLPRSQIDLYFPLPGELVERKLESLRVQHSQTEGMFAGLPLAELRQTAAEECFMHA